MQSTTLTIGTTVRRIGSESDRNTGRIGNIVEIDEAAGRYRVLWTIERSGRPVLHGSSRKPGVRTWVKYQFVQVVAQ